MSRAAKFSLGEFDRMIECAVFDVTKRRRIEFIHGELREMGEVGPEHEWVVDLLNEWSGICKVRDHVRVRIQSSLGLASSDSAPRPDMAWVVKGSYFTRRPTAEEALLVIEVAAESLAYDRGEKAKLYAAAGVADYWILNLIEQRIEVHRQPEHGRYRSLTILCKGQEGRPLKFPDLPLAVSELFAD